MGKYLLGIDNGNTVSKVAIFDLNGKELQVAACKVETDYPQPGWTERSMAGLWQGVVTAIQEAVAKAAINPADIVGIGCSGHGNGMYLLDKAGQPLGNGIQSIDSRASAIVDGWHEAGLHQQVFPQTLQAFWPAQPNALLAWIKAHEPARYDAVGAVLLCKDYVNYCLTGQIRTDYSDISATSLFDIPRKQYSKELLSLYGIPEIYEALPRPAHSYEVIGQVTAAAAEATGLAAGTAVVAGMFDVDASAIGAGVCRPGQACLIAGTWSINEIVTAEPIIDPGLFMTTIFADPALFLTIEGSATSATNLEWFVAQCCGDERAEAQQRGVSVFEICSEEVAGVPLDSSNIIFHPFLYGSYVQPSARAGFYGVAGWHTRAHLLRALFEGVVFGHLSHIEKLRAAGGQIDSARLAGGGSRSPVWSQMFADTIQVPMAVPDGNELGARGAALSAGIGAGIYRDYAEAVQEAVSIVRVHEPNPTHTPVYLARYAQYQRLVEVMREPWQELHQLD